MLCKTVSAVVNARGMSVTHIPQGQATAQGLLHTVHVVHLSYKLLEILSGGLACLFAAEGTRQKMQMQASHLCHMVAQPT